MWYLSNLYLCISSFLFPNSSGYCFNDDVTYRFIIYKLYDHTVFSSSSKNVTITFIRTKTPKKQECIPVGCILIATVATTRCQFRGVCVRWGGGGRGHPLPPVNRMTDSRLWKHYLPSRLVIIPQSSPFSEMVFRTNQVDIYVEYGFALSQPNDWVKVSQITDVCTTKNGSSPTLHARHACVSIYRRVKLLTQSLKGWRSLLSTMTVKSFLIAEYRNQQGYLNWTDR